MDRSPAVTLEKHSSHVGAVWALHVGHRPGRAAGAQPRSTDRTGVLTFFAEIFIVRTALAEPLALGVAVALPPSFKGLEAATFTRKLYPEQNKTSWVTDELPRPGTGSRGPPSSRLEPRQDVSKSLIWTLGNKCFPK